MHFFAGMVKQAEAYRPAYEQKSILFSRHKPLCVEALSECLQAGSPLIQAFLTLFAIAFIEIQLFRNAWVHVLRPARAFGS